MKLLLIMSYRDWHPKCLLLVTRCVWVVFCVLMGARLIVRTCWSSGHSSQSGDHVVDLLLPAGFLTYLSTPGVSHNRTSFSCISLRWSYWGQSRKPNFFHSIVTWIKYGCQRLNECKQKHRYHEKCNLLKHNCFVGLVYRWLGVYRITKVSYRVGMLFTAVVSRVSLASRKTYCGIKFFNLYLFSTFRKRTILISLIIEVTISWYERLWPNVLSVLHKHYGSTDFVKRTNWFS